MVAQTGGPYRKASFDCPSSSSEEPPALGFLRGRGQGDGSRWRFGGCLYLAPLLKEKRGYRDKKKEERRVKGAQTAER